MFDKNMISSIMECGHMITRVKRHSIKPCGLTLLYSHSFLSLFLPTIYLITREGNANRSDEILDTLGTNTRLE
jgi:hypothetical protein